VVVVHGMGEPRPNETVIPVIDRFAEGRSESPWPPPPSVLTLGAVSGQNERPWTSFTGIPRDRISVAAPFLGEAARGDQMLRFVDIHWGDLLKDAYPLVGQSPNLWADAILGRLVRKDAYAARSGRPQERVPPWTLKVLELLRETIAVTDLVLRLRLAQWRDVIFGQYLGDVQLYGEYPVARGQAVRRFHDRLAAVEHAHQHEFGDAADAPQARYTVIAHSLGTVMAMDALLYAHTHDAIRAGTEAPGFGLPFPGYATSAGEVAPNVAWAERVDSFVTLGSPIDKFLFMWWLNYEYLQHPADWLEPMRRRHGRILHFNLSEEQDPVGHTVDLAKTSPAFRDVFDTVEDRVYVRYAVPGLAHIHYWEDREVFQWILQEAVDFVPPEKRTVHPVWFDARVYRRVIFFAYSLLPFATIAACFVTLMLAWRADTWPARALGSGVFFLTCVFGRRLIDLNLWWRQVLKQKISIWRWRPALGADLRQWLSFGGHDDPEAVVRTREEGTARAWMVLTALGWGLAAAASFGLFTAFWISSASAEQQTLLGGAGPRAFVIAATMGLCSLVWRALQRENAPHPMIARTAASRLPIGGVVMALLLLAFAAGGGTAVWLRTMGPTSPPAHVGAWLKQHLGHARLGDLLIHLVVVSAIGAVVMTYRILGFRAIKRTLSDPTDAARQQLQFHGYAGTPPEKVAL
jgi:hypothetical protein